MNETTRKSCPHRAHVLEGEPNKEMRAFTIGDKWYGGKKTGVSKIIIRKRRGGGAVIAVFSRVGGEGLLGESSLWRR